MAARFSLRRSLSVFCGFFFCCFFGLSELLATTTSAAQCPRNATRPAGAPRAGASPWARRPDVWAHAPGLGRVPAWLARHLRRRGSRRSGRRFGPLVGHAVSSAARNEETGRFQPVPPNGAPRFELGTSGPPVKRGGRRLSPPVAESPTFCGIPRERPCRFRRLSLGVAHKKAHKPEQRQCGCSA